MPVTITEVIKIRDDKGVEHEGSLLIGNLVAIQEGENIVYGAALDRVRIDTKIVCDSGADCVNSYVDDKFTTHPKTIEFTEDGKSSPEFIKDIAEIVVASDYLGEKVVFCTKDCMMKFFKKDKKEKEISIASGKGFRTADLPESGK